MMIKKFILLLIIACVSIANQSAQTYKSIFEGNPVWNVFGEGIDHFTTLEYFKKDTIKINDTLYYKVGPFNQDILLREDSSHAKIFFRDDNTEICVMNLNLNKNDTFYFNTLHSYESQALIVDSIYYLGDRKIVELSYEYNLLGKHEKLSFIEGIGPTKSRHYEYVFGLGDPTLICFSNDNYHWKNDVDSCNIDFTVAIETINEKTLQIFPNPVRNSFIQINDMEGYVCELLDTQGRIFKHKKLLSNNEKLPITDLKNGLYFIRLIKDNKIITTKIFVQK